MQFLVLEHSRSHPAVIHYTDNIRQLGTLSAAGCLPISTVQRLQQIYKSYRLRLHRLALDDKVPLIGDEEFSEDRSYVEGVWKQVFHE